MSVCEAIKQFKSEQNSLLFLRIGVIVIKYQYVIQ